MPPAIGLLAGEAFRLISALRQAHDEFVAAGWGLSLGDELGPLRKFDRT